MSTFDVYNIYLLTALSFKMEIELAPKCKHEQIYSLYSKNVSYPFKKHF